METGKRSETSFSWAYTPPSDGKSAMVSISGSLTIMQSHGLAESLLRKLRPEHLEYLDVSLAELKYLDSAGAMSLVEMQKGLSTCNVRFVAASPESARILSLVNNLDLSKVSIKTGEDLGVISYLGRTATLMTRDAFNVLAFLGELLAVFWQSVKSPGSVRWGSVLFYMRRAGLDGLPIVGLISFLIGVVMAFMSSLQLKQFGADIYVAALVGLAIVKELGPIMTAIIVAGRLGAAFSAEIGTMMVNMEVDALTTMGFNPVSFLAMPKVLAAMLVVPVLTVYSFMFGIGGGMMVGVLGLNLSVYTYVQQTLSAITAFDVVSSLVKSVVFAFLIAGIGCQRGFQVRGGAEAVGALTTSAVVSAIFLVIVADSVFAVLLHYIQG